MGKTNRTDKDRFDWLANNENLIVYLDRDDDLRTNYVSAKEWIEERVPGLFEGVPEGELQRMKDTDTIWCLQVYPQTPNGFHQFYAATMQAVIDAAMDAEMQREGKDQ